VWANLAAGMRARIEAWLPRPKEKRKKKRMKKNDEKNKPKILLALFHNRRFYN